MAVSRFDRRPPERDTTRTNERIRVPEVRLIDENGEQQGIKPTPEAKQAMGRDIFDMSRRPAALRAGYAQASDVAGAVNEFWCP